jgi:protein O-mannosyl-transferase
VPHAVLLVVAAVAAAQVPRYVELFAFSAALRGVGDNLAAQVHAVTWLAGQLVRLDRLNADPALPVQTLNAAGVALLVAWSAAGALAFALRRRQPALLFAWLWFLLWLLPTHSVLARADLASERALYLPLIGPAFVIGTWLTAVAPRRRWLLAVPVLIALAFVTHTRNAIYADEVRFWADVAAKAPHNARAFTNLGVALMDACRLDEAASALASARVLAPDDIKSAANEQLLPARQAQCRAAR